MELSKIQNKAIGNLLEKAEQILSKQSDDNINKSVYFKAPTGSGKTFMMLNFIDKLINLNESKGFNLNLVFVIVTLSSAELPKQMEQSFKKYRDFIDNKNIEINRIESPSNSNVFSEKNYEFQAEPNSVWIMGGATFRTNTILDAQGSLEIFLNELKRNNYTLIYIRDEAHIGAEQKVNSKSKLSNFEQGLQNSANFILKMTATPPTDSIYQLVEIKEKDLINDNIKLIKPTRQFNKGLQQGQQYDSDEILNIACEEFKKIKSKYNDSENEPGLVGINPAMLIQVDNKSSNNEEEFNKNIDKIISILEKHNLTWVKYFDSNNKNTNLRQKENWNLQDISKENSPCDVIIFKIGPATGWNIPRACMLVQLRNVSSSNLSIQTIGRIKRNPNPNFDFDKESVANEYFIYSNTDDRKLKNIRIATLQDKYMDQYFLIGEIDKDTVQKLNEDFIEHYEDKLFSLLSDAFNQSDNKSEWDKDKIQKYFNSKLYKIIIEEYFEKGYIASEQESHGDSTWIANSSKIYNIFELEKWNIANINRHKKFFTVNVQKYLDDLLDFCNKNIDFNQFQGSENPQKLDISKQQSQFFWYIIYENFAKEFKSMYSKTKNEVDKTNIEYKVKKVQQLPKQFVLFEDEDTKNVIKETNDIFAYKINNENIKDFPLDSEPEKIFVNEILNYTKKDKIKKNGKENEEEKSNDESQDNIKLWSKNPVYNGIGFNYINNDQKISYSYPDFMIKKNNHLIYFEVKKYNNDIDDNKTEQIHKAYEEYIKIFNKDKQNPDTALDVKFSLILVLVKDANTIYYAGFSSLEQLNEKLSETNNKNTKIHDKIKSTYSLTLKDILEQE
ncbi:DEAD/DEAH box helicase family protein [Mesomycoplasma bovoculi]|uniref:Type III restriction enzyme, res subunit n=1 Tax=Mesomycoplasma bovoculi M165/69 TaxID=743966 RepID=W5UTN2_9BACT|nr:DEAD/DEAH box helicase family protein [Mesomycoplasma bovoculi]AHH45482.1 type III restriction enzyme, res subunit [Mesomycoplasma bovoculi M165/69]